MKEIPLCYKWSNCVVEKTIITVLTPIIPSDIIQSTGWLMEG
jgi:hypothetical protein